MPNFARARVTSKTTPVIERVYGKLSNINPTCVPEAPTRESLARDLGVSYAAVSNAVQQLASQGRVSEVPNYDGFGNPARHLFPVGR